MTDTQTQPRPITAAPGGLNIPSGTPHNARLSGLSLDTFSPVTQYGSFEFDRIIKQGEVLKRTRKTKSWKPIYIVLRPNLLSIYRDNKESKLRHQINLSELTAVARQRDPKRKDKHVFGLFSPSRNFHLEAHSDKDAQQWVELIRREARMDEQEEEMYLASPGGANTAYRGFERTMNSRIMPLADEQNAGDSSSDAEAGGQSQPLPKQRDRESVSNRPRRSSHMEYSGAEHGSFSDFSDSGLAVTAHMSSLSLGQTDRLPSTSSSHVPHATAVYGPASTRPSTGGRDLSQTSILASGAEEKKVSNVSDEERIVCHGWIYLLKSKSGVRQWKKVWMVLRPKQLAIYKDGEEYTAQLILRVSSIIDAVEIDPISKTKSSCMQVISEERNYRFCAVDEESLAKWLGAFKSLLSKRNVKGQVATR